MLRSRTAGAALAVLAALLWSPGYEILSRVRTDETHPLTLLFHFVFWAALVLWALLILFGRSDDLSVFKRSETHVVVLVAAGGYGLWLLRALAAQEMPGRDLQLCLYTAPLWIAIFSLLTPERVHSKQMAGLLMGFVGCIMLLMTWPGLSSGGWPPMPPMAKALGSAACPGLFTVALRPLVREEKVLPVVALVMGLGAACLLVTCVSMGVSIRALTGRQLSLCALAGIGSVAVPYLLWAKSLSVLPPATAAPFWYLGALFAVVWARLGGASPSFWWTMGGAILIFLCLKVAVPPPQRPSENMGDIIRRGGP